MLTPFRFFRTLDLVHRGFRSRPLARLAERFCRRGLVLERRLDERLADFEPLLGVELGTLDLGSIGEFLEYLPGRRREYVERRFAAGDVCFAAREGGDLVGTIWGSCGERWVDDLQLTWRTGPQEVYLYDSNTAPEQRGNGICPALTAHALRFFSDRGLQRAVVIVAPDNTANLRAMAKVGFERTGDVRACALGFGRHLHWRRRLPAAAGTP